MALQRETRTSLLPDGRTLSYAIYGDQNPEAPTVFYFHGYPGSHYEASPLDSAAVARGLRIVSLDRPGMCRSTFQPDRKLTDWPADVLHIADELQTPTFGLWGTSGGGPYVLACCTSPEFRNRVKVAVILAGLYPPKLGLAGMLYKTRLLFFVAPWATGLVGAAMDWGVGVTARENPEKLGKMLDEEMGTRPGPDRKMWEEDETGIFRKALLDSTRAAFEESGRGAAWEARIYGCDWGFELQDVQVEKGKLIAWHGTEDVNVPVAMAEKAQKLIDGMELRISPGEAHMSVVAHKFEEILDVLKDKMT